MALFSRFVDDRFEWKLDMRTDWRVRQRVWQCLKAMPSLTLCWLRSLWAWQSLHCPVVLSHSAHMCWQLYAQCVGSVLPSRTLSSHCPSSPRRACACETCKLGEC